MKTFVLGLLCLLPFCSMSQTDTAQLDLRTYANKIVGDEGSPFARARVLLQWLSTNFTWTATDYQSRTVKEIIVRKGGNCFELAKVYMALAGELALPLRPIAEINLHVPKEERGESAGRKIAERGNRMSVFGYQHNDHRWVEVYNERSDEWIPVDPTMNLFGYEAWLKARAWFGERHSMHEEIGRDMIAPFAIFVTDKQNSGLMIEDRTQQYMVRKLDSLYGGRLSALASWNNWVEQLKQITPHAQAAFGGKENLHVYGELIDRLRHTYDQLKAEYEAKFGRQ